MLPEILPWASSSGEATAGELIGMPGLGPGAQRPFLLRLYPFTATTKNFRWNNFLLKGSVIKGAWKKERWDEKWLCSPTKCLSISLQVLDHEVLRHLPAKSSRPAVIMCHCLHIQAVTVWLVCGKISSESHKNRGYYCCVGVWSKLKKVGQEKRRKVFQCKAFFFKREIAEVSTICIYIEVIQKLCTD